MPLTKNSKKGSGRDVSPEAGPSKRDKYSSDEEEELPLRKGQHSKIFRQGGHNKRSPSLSKSSGHVGHNKPAELFRKDLISAMKLADTEILFEEDYVVISDPWRMEWERGVQVPVNQEEILPCVITQVKPKDKKGDFKLPPRKYLHEQNDETYQATQHELTGMQELSESIVRYDLDNQDVIWLELVNEDREEMGLQLINEWNCERMIEELENQCYAKTNAVKKTEEGLGIEYDEDVACDVCRQLESEDTNEMVFCDGCDMCVHQACYGIQTIPEGSWLCRICAMGIKPMCLLCPKRGGAMKSTRSGTKWTHVSCALWIPEVSIGCSEKMEPITKISNIPPSRWALVCCLCKERVGACIQCSVKQCKTAFHVTCGFAHNLDMRTILDDSDELDGVHLRAYCPKHTKNRNASDSDSPKKGEEEEECNENEISEAEMIRQRAEKLRQLEEEFYTLIDLEAVASKFFIPLEAVDIVAEYWKLKRKLNDNKPLITPKLEEEDRMQKQQQDSLSARMKMFVHLRQDLERARNLCYMIGKREKTKRQLFKLKESVFRAQVRVLTDPNLNLSAREAERVRGFYSFDSLYNNYGANLAQGNKAPRKNLFTLDNLKTPKDEAEHEQKLDPCMDSDRQLLFQAAKNEKKGALLRMKSGSSSMDFPLTGVKSERSCSPSQQEKVFTMDNFQLSDAAVESSEEDSAHRSKRDSSHMSRLGKVTVKSEEVDDGKTITVLGTKPECLNKNKKFVPGNDLRKKLTSILQSKNMKHRQEELSTDTGDHSCQQLSIQVENSDSEVFTSDTNTDLTSPMDPQRNLFEQFTMTQSWPKKPCASSPDLPSHSRDSRRRKSKKRKWSHAPHQHRSKPTVTTPDQTASSSFSTKQEDLDRVSLHRAEQLASSCIDHQNSSDNPVVSADTLHTEVQCTSHSPPRHLKSPRGKKRRHGDSCSPNKLLRSSPRKQTQVSPLPHIKTEEVYATLGDDIYVPTGKIQVTERTIVLDDPRIEDKARLRSKLKLKKQANSLVKGVVSYEVVREVGEETNSSEVHESGTCNEEGQVSEPPVQDLVSEAQCDILPDNQRTRPDSGLVTRSSKLLSDSDGNVQLKQKEELRKNLFGVGNSAIGRRERRKRRSAIASAISGEAGYSSDENFRPDGGSPKANILDRSQRARRSRGLRSIHPDEIEGDDELEDFEPVISPQRKCSHNHNDKGMKLKPLPNRPDLTDLLDSSKLVVKEPLKRRVGERLTQMLKYRRRSSILGNAKDVNQTTLDKFVKRTSGENVFSKISALKTSPQHLPRSDMNPLSVSHPISKSDIFSSKTEKEPVPVSPMQASVASSNVFGAHTSPQTRFHHYKIPKKSTSSHPPAEIPHDKSAEDTCGVFGEVHRHTEGEHGSRLSFTEVGQKGEQLEDVMKTPSKCDSREMSEDHLDGNRSYRSQSPPSSEGSGASSRILSIESRESTPRRLTRSRLNEESGSPVTSNRLRTRDSLLKPPQFQAS